MSTFTETRPTSHRHTLALTISVVLNLFLAALIGGHLLRVHLERRSTPAGDTPMARQLARIESVLPARDAAAFRAVIERDHSRFAGASRQLVAARRALRRQIVADPFDPKATSRALSAYRTSWNAFVSEFSGPLIQALSQISPQGRRDLVTARRRARERSLSERSRR